MKKDLNRALDAFAAMDSLPESMIAEAENALITAEGRLAPPVKRPTGGLARFMSSGWTAAAISCIVALGVLIFIVRAGREAPTYQPPVKPAGCTIEMADEGADFTLSMEQESYPDGTNRFTVIMTAKSPGKRISMWGGWHLERLTEDGAEVVEISYTEDALISAKPGRNEYATLTKSIFGTNTGGGFPAGTYRLHATEYDGEKYVSVAYCTFTVEEPDETVTPPTDETAPPVLEYPPAAEQTYTVTTPETLEYGAQGLSITVKAAEPGVSLTPHRNYRIVKLAGPANGTDASWMQTAVAVEVMPTEENGGYAVYGDSLTFTNPDQWLPGLYRLYALNWDEEYIDYCDFVITGDHGFEHEMFLSQTTYTTVDTSLDVQILGHEKGGMVWWYEGWSLYAVEGDTRTLVGRCAPIEIAYESPFPAENEFVLLDIGQSISNVTDGKYKTLSAGDYELVFGNGDHAHRMPFTVVEDPDKQLISGTFLWVNGDPMLWDGGQYLPTHLLATEGVSFDGLTTGDYIEVIVGAIHETAPPTAQVHKIATGALIGKPEYVSKEYVAWLAEMGYTVTAYPVATQTLTGFFLPSGSTNLLITDRKEVTILNPADGYEVYVGGLTAGDRVEVTVDTILESWPGQTHLYALRKLSDGDVSDIPADILAKLKENGWYVADE